MKNRTYKNMLKTVRMIQEKGYTFEEAQEMAIKKWDEYDTHTMKQKYAIGDIERFINMIVPKEDFTEQLRREFSRLQDAEEEAFYKVIRHEISREEYDTINGRLNAFYRQHKACLQGA